MTADTFEVARSYVILKSLACITSGNPCSTLGPNQLLAKDGIEILPLC